MEVTGHVNLVKYSSCNFCSVTVRLIIFEYFFVRILDFISLSDFLPTIHFTFCEFSNLVIWIHIQLFICIIYGYMFNYLYALYINMYNYLYALYINIYTCYFLKIVHVFIFSFLFVAVWTCDWSLVSIKKFHRHRTILIKILDILKSNLDETSIR